MAAWPTVTVKVEIVNLPRFERAVRKFLKGTANLTDVKRAVAALRTREVKSRKT